MTVTTIDIPADSLFGIDNLPYGIFSPAGGSPRVGVRVADSVVDLAATLGDSVFAEPTLNAFMALGRDQWVSVRNRITDLVTGEIDSDAVFPVDSVTMHLPIAVADYVDFYASENHATNLGRLFRPDAAPLM
ncbi:MAG: fumarylacetoacetase, partial [Rhodococcus sp. (in: high G+C Gram-positive bacteria)]|nr:fumarylacetoacetase [Rhodococcus sp. (in: high G+C Gram-positive bacteria)]